MDLDLELKSVGAEGTVGFFTANCKSCVEMP